MPESALNNIFANVVTRIIDNVPEIKTVDIDLGQLEEQPPQIPYEAPALLFRFENIIWTDLDDTRQIGLVHVRLRLIFPFEDDGENYSISHTVRDSVRQFCLIAEHVHEQIMSIDPHNHTKLKRFNQRHHIVEDKTLVWMHVIDYMCNVYSDNSDIDPNMLSIDFENIRQRNVVFERRKLIV